MLVKVSPLAPAFEPSSAGNGIALFKGDFSGPVTAWPSPGDIVQTYMTGLGPVDVNGEVKSGFSCSFDFTQGDILFAGLAPGLTGSYQVNIRVRTCIRALRFSAVGGIQ